jgi:1-acyl-sn-glycerol-3-phosphate acyltransferase
MMEAVALFSIMNKSMPCYTAKYELSKIPFIGFWGKSIGTMFIKRDDKN